MFILKENNLNMLFISKYFLTDSYSKVFTFLQSQKNIGSQQFDQMVRITPIMTGGDLSVSFYNNIDRTILNLFLDS